MTPPKSTIPVGLIRVSMHNLWCGKLKREEVIQFCDEYPRDASFLRKKTLLQGFQKLDANGNPTDPEPFKIHPSSYRLDPEFTYEVIWEGTSNNFDIQGWLNKETGEFFDFQDSTHIVKDRISRESLIYLVGCSRRLHALASGNWSEWAPLMVKKFDALLLELAQTDPKESKGMLDRWPPLRKEISNFVKRTKSKR